MLYTLAAGLLVMVASLSGGIFASNRLSSWTSRNLKYLISFSTGVVLVTTWHLMEESFGLAASPLTAIVYMVAGALIVLIVSNLIPEYHHHHIEDECCSHSKKGGAVRILIGDSLHNIGDGILLATAFAVDVRVGIIATLGVLVHEVLQEIAEFFVLRDAGYTTGQALGRNLISASSVFVGIAIAALLQTYQSIEPLLLGFSAGIFAFVTVQDLIPTVISHSRSDMRYARYVFLVVAGALVMFTITELIHV